MASATVVPLRQVARLVLFCAMGLSFGTGLFGIRSHGTLLVNISGSGLMGCLAGAIAAGMVLPEAWQVFCRWLAWCADDVFQLCADAGDFGSRVW